MLEGRNISKTYVREGFLGSRLGSVEALKNVSFSVRKGEVLGIVGESGSGKSTLAKIVCGIEKATSGTLEWDRGALKNSEFPAQMVFQNPYNSLNPKLTVGYTLREALSCGRKERISRIGEPELRGILEKVEMKDIGLSNYPHQFSGGQRQRLGIARALAMNPDILVCDEPVSALDISIQAQIINLLKDINRNAGLTVIFIAHDIEAVGMISDSIIVMKEGLVVERGDKRSVLKAPSDGYTKKLLDAVPRNPWLA